MNQTGLYTPKKSIQSRGKLHSLEQPIVMGILNITPDSFYDGGKYYADKEKIRKQYLKMKKEGADLIDIGAYSSRPGATNISEKEEFRRLSQVLDIINHEGEGPLLSIDTFRSGIVRQVTKDFSIDFVNDITAGETDPTMLNQVAKAQTGYIAMHMQGTPATMQNMPSYRDVTTEIIQYLSKKKAQLTSLGIKDIIVDPGFGFGKTIEHNYTLLRTLSQFQILECPILVGLSRKSMVYKPLGKNPQEALHGTGALHFHALEKGARILRVHDVKEAKEIIALWLQLHPEQESIL